MSVLATTTDGLGFLADSRGIAAVATASLEPKARLFTMKLFDTQAGELREFKPSRLAKLVFMFVVQLFNPLPTSDTFAQLWFMTC